MDDPNVVMIKKLYSKIAESMAVDPSRSVLVLENPGTLIDPDYNPADGDDRYDWSTLVGRIPEPNWIYEDTGIQTSELWEIILSDKVLPTETLTPAERAELARAYAVVRRINGQPTNTFRDYRRYEQLHATAQDELYFAQQDYYNSGRPVPPSLVRNVQISLEDWEAFGHKATVETALAKIQSLQGRDPANWWADLTQRFAASIDRTNMGTDFYRIGTQPPREALDPGIRWSAYSFTDSDYQYQRESTQVRYGGGASVNFGLWRASAGATYSRDQGFVRSSTDAVSITFEARRVVIDNYWLNPLVFQTRSWGWGENTVGAGLGYICNGDSSTHNGICGGIMPLMPVGLLLAKNIRISGTFSEHERTWLREQVNARASFGWGPFSIGGHYSKRTEKDYATGSVTSTGVESPHMQVLGWFCRPLGKTPDPDFGMNWPTEPVITDRSPVYRRSLRTRVRWREEATKLCDQYAAIADERAI